MSTNNVINNLNQQQPTQQVDAVYQSKQENSIIYNLYSTVVLPTVKNMFSNLLHNTINMIFGYTPSYNSYSNVVNYNPYGATNYSRISTYSVGNTPAQSYGAPIQQPQQIQPTTNSIYMVNQVRLASEGEAQATILSLKEILSNQGFVRVSDYYNIRNLQSDFTCVNYGWYNLDSIKIESRYDGYYIIFPRIQIIK